MIYETNKNIKIKADISPSLIEVHQKHNVVTETGQSVSRWHGNDKCKYVINESIESLTVNKK